MKKPIQSQPEGSGAPKKILKQNQPEGFKAPKKILKPSQPEGSGAPKKKLKQNQPEGSGAPKKKFMYSPKTDKKVNKTTTSKISPRGLAFRAARKANKKVFEFPKGSGKMFTTKLKGEDKKVTNVVKKKTNGSKKVMVDSFKKSNVNKNKKPASKMGIDGAATTKKKTNGGKTGLGSKTMSTKTPKTFKGTNITPTKLQRQRMRKRMMGST